MCPENMMQLPCLVSEQWPRKDFQGEGYNFKLKGKKVKTISQCAGSMLGLISEHRSLQRQDFQTEGHNFKVKEPNVTITLQCTGSMLG